MKKIILVIAAVLISNFSTTQNFTKLSNYQFNSIENYTTEQDKVLTCANYLFNNPSHKEEMNRLISLQYIMKWMEGTPNYTFEIGADAVELTKGNSDLLGLYLAAMSKVVLETKDVKLDNNDIYLKAENILVDYCSNSKNKIKPSKKIRKLIKSRKS